MSILSARSIGVRRLTEVIPNVFQIPLFGTSSVLILEDQVTIVDAGWKGNGRRVLEALAGLGRHPEEISYLVSTHYHLDHIGGMAHLCQNCQAKVAAHELEAPFMLPNAFPALPSPTPNQLLTLLMRPILDLLRPAQFAVDIELQHGSQLEPLGGMEVIHSPGHTPGSISLYFPREGLLMVGDALQFKGRKLDLPSRVFSTNMAQAKESIQKLAQLDFEVLCFSHFSPLKKDAAKTLREFAETLR